MSRPLTSFARVPERLIRLLERDEITAAAFLLMVYIVGRCDPSTGEWVGTLEALMSGARWTHSGQYLRQQLRRLRALGELEFDVRQGQRTPWVIRVVGEGYGLDFQLTSNGKAVASWKSTSNSNAVTDGATAVPERDPDPRRLPTDPEATGTDLDVDVDLTGPHWRAGAADASPRPAPSIDIDDERAAAFDDLVSVLRDADEKTWNTFARNFSELTVEEIDYVTAEVVKRVDGYNGNEPLRSPAAYAHELLANRLNGTNGTKDLPDRWMAP